MVAHRQYEHLGRQISSEKVVAGAAQVTHPGAAAAACQIGSFPSGARSNRSGCPRVARFLTI